MTVDPSRLQLQHYPAEILRCTTRPIDHIDQTVRAVAQRMIEIMYEQEGVGLAAPQVGLDWRLFVTAGFAERKTEQDEPGPDRVFINPRLTLGRGEMTTKEEGCLSLPGIQCDVRRPSTASIEALDLDGESFQMQADGFLARVWQHEFDHLNGLLIIDKMLPMDRLRTRKQLKELEAAAQ